MKATYIPRQTGGYLAGVVVTDSAGVEVGRAESGWTADPAADEFRSLRPNRALLEQIARQTGGKLSRLTSWPISPLPCRTGKRPLPRPGRIPCGTVPWYSRSPWPVSPPNGASGAGKAWYENSTGSVFRVQRGSDGFCGRRGTGSRRETIGHRGCRRGGEEEFGKSFRELGATLAQSGGKGRSESPGHRPRTKPTKITDLEKLKQALNAEPGKPSEELWLVFLGHGTYGDKEAKFNLRGPDFSSTELAAWLHPFKTSGRHR